MDIRRHADPPSRGSFSNVELFLLSMILAFCLWFGGGWILAGQISPHAVDPTTADVIPDGVPDRWARESTPVRPDGHDCGEASPAAPIDLSVDLRALVSTA